LKPALTLAANDTMFKAHNMGEEAPEVAFYYEEKEVEEEGNKKINNNSNINKLDVDKNEDTKSTTRYIACVECGKEPCVFAMHEELLITFDDTDHGNSSGIDVVPSNNLRHKEAVPTADTYAEWRASGQAAASRQSEICSHPIPSWDSKRRNEVLSSTL
jgi:hypothetical protein